METYSEKEADTNKSFNYLRGRFSDSTTRWLEITYVLFEFPYVTLLNRQTDSVQCTVQFDLYLLHLHFQHFFADLFFCSECHEHDRFDRFQITLHPRLWSEALVLKIKSITSKT